MVQNLSNPFGHCYLTHAKSNIRDFSFFNPLMPELNPHPPGHFSGHSAILRAHCAKYIHTYIYIYIYRLAVKG